VEALKSDNLSEPSGRTYLSELITKVRDVGDMIIIFKLDPYGCEGVAKILLEREDINPDQADTRYGERPLSWAVMSVRHSCGQLKGGMPA